MRFQLGCGSSAAGGMSGDCFQKSLVCTGNQKSQIGSKFQVHVFFEVFFENRWPKVRLGQFGVVAKSSEFAKRRQ